jgi:hypothetical protein
MRNPPDEPSARFWMIYSLAVLAVVALGFVLLRPAHADTVPLPREKPAPCQSERIADLVIGAAEITDAGDVSYMTGAYAAAWMLAYNAKPPASDFKSDFIVRIDVRSVLLTPFGPVGPPRSFLMFFHEGCFVTYSAEPPALMKAVDRDARRRFGMIA